VSFCRRTCAVLRGKLLFVCEGSLYARTKAGCGNLDGGAEGTSPRGEEGRGENNVLSVRIKPT